MGAWIVRREGETAPLSQHLTVTDAERAARRLDSESILLHDRYRRVHAIVVAG